MQAWNLALRFVLELGALAGLAVGGWSLGGLQGVVATVLAPLVALAFWGAFNVPGDPSRSGRAPVPVPGPLRLVIELGILAGGYLGWAFAGMPAISLILAALAVGHYVAGWRRLAWLVRQPRRARTATPR